MRRGLTLVAAMAFVMSSGIASAWAGPSCCKSKAVKAECAEKASTCSKSTCCTKAEFPSMAIMAGEKTFECPIEASKYAEENKAKVVFAVAGEKYDDQAAAMTAYADASESFLTNYTRIACKVDGKWMFCDDDAKACTDACSKGDGKDCCLNKAKTVAAKSDGCCKDKGVKVADKGATCTKGATTVAAKGDGCCKSGAKAASDKAGCCKDKSVTVADKGATCTKGEKTSTCTKGETSMAKATCSDKCDAFFVVGREFKTMDEAVKARDAAVESMGKVRMAYIVDGKKVDCSSQVCPKAKAAGKVKYVVGDREMDCEMMARVSLARAQYEAVKTSDKVAKL